MPYRNKLREALFAAPQALRAFSANFLAPFLLVSSIAFLVMHETSVQTQFFREGYFLTYALASLCASFVLWQLYAPHRPLKDRIHALARVAAPALLAVGILLSIIPNDFYDGFETYGLIIFVTACIVAYARGTKATNEAGMATEASPEAEHGVMFISRRLYRAAAIGIIILGIALCARDAYLTPTISVDEAHSSNAAYGILSRGLPYFPNTEVVYSRSWVNLYSIAGSYQLFGVSEFSARLPSVAAYGLALIFFFLALRLIASRAVTLGALALFALNPWILHYGSYARMYVFLLLFSTVFSYLTLRWLKTKDPTVLYAYLPLTLVLGLFSERTFLLFLPPYGLMVLASLPRTRRFWKRIALYAILPALAAIAAAAYAWFVPISAFVSRYIIGFNNGQDLFAYAKVSFVPVEWLSFYGFPAIFLALATVLIILRGNLSSRLFLALFWFGEFLVDILIYSNFPARRFNYAFILVSLYSIVLIYGTSIFFKLVRRWQAYALGAFMLAFGLYHAVFPPTFPTYADFSQLQLAPRGSRVLGYPTSPMVFYNNKLGLGHSIQPFITDRIEMDKYVQNGTEIYSGGVFVTGVTGLNELRATQDVYVFYEKTRIDFLNLRTASYVMENCVPLTPESAAAVQQLMADKYQPTAEDYDTRNTMLALRCPQLPTEVPVLP